MSKIAANSQPSGSWLPKTWNFDFFGFFKLPKTPLGIFAAVSTGVVLFGATSYFIACKVRNSRRKKVPTSRRDVFDQQIDSDEEDEFFSEFHRKKSEREQANFAPVVFTFEDLFEKAL